MTITPSVTGSAIGSSSLFTLYRRAADNANALQVIVRIPKSEECYKKLICERLHKMNQQSLGICLTFSLSISGMIGTLIKCTANTFIRFTCRMFRETLRLFSALWTMPEMVALRTLFVLREYLFETRIGTLNNARRNTSKLSLDYIGDILTPPSIYLNTEMFALSFGS